ncbi:S1C family serine protease [Azospirillum sp. TSO35-2]|uniref:S1C family serine protease n=1 Tax=Azospirillum sp. TSO35-2 TaxID=716796 RepID=UPI000D651698|nr:S1C family serine protease [Azospirillum sp. TSO35-2]
MKPDPRRFAALSTALLLLPILAGCQTAVPASPSRPAPAVAPGTTAPFRFGELAIGSMRRGMQIGRYVWGLDCAPPYDDVYWTSGVNMRRGATFDERFGETMTAAGFDVVGRLGGPDSPDGNRSRARFTVQGDLTDVRLELCHRSHWLTGADKGTSGSGSVKVDWTVYDARSGQLVHRLATTGTATHDNGVPQGDTLLIEEAFAGAVEALAGDGGFRTLLSGGGVPAASATPGMAPRPVAAAAGSAAGSGPLPLTPAAPSMAFPPAAASRLLLRTSAGSGRTAVARVPVAGVHGLVIGETEVGGEAQAVLLAPVPGSDPTVTVRPARGVELTGWVVGRDTASGFALLRVPARLAALPLRTVALRISEPVRAVPDGGGREIAGIVGGLLSDDGAKGSLIQADLGSAALFGGVTEAGDPLLDGNGALVGVAVASGRSVVTPAGLVEFLALGPLLNRLGADPVGGASSDPALSGSSPDRGGPRATDRGGRRRDAKAPPAWQEDALDGDGDPPT